MKLEISSAALQDLKEIKNYISDKLGNPTAAQRTIGKIRESLLLLSDTPYIGSMLKNRINTKSSYRFLTCGNYLIFYLAEKEKVIVSRIIYGKRNYAKCIFKTDFDNSEDF